MPSAGLTNILLICTLVDMDKTAESTTTSPETYTPPTNPTAPAAPATPIASNPLAHADMQSTPSETPPTTPPPHEPTSSPQGSFSEEPSHNSSKKLLIFLIIAVIVLIISGIMFFMMQGGFTNSTTVPTPTPQQIALPTPTTEITPTRGTTNTDLEMDSQDIEAQLNSVDSTSTGVDESLNDQAPNLQ